jgi:hypothetical protein
MNIIDLINISSNNRKFISVLGFGEPTTSLDLLTGMVNGKVEPYSFDIQIEPNPNNQNFVPKAIDIVNESKNRFGITSSYSSVEKSNLKNNSKIVIINSFTNTESLLSETLNTVDIGSVIALTLYNDNSLVKEQVTKFINEQNIGFSFADSKEIPYIIKNEAPIKKLYKPKVTRTKSLMT